MNPPVQSPSTGAVPAGHRSGYVAIIGAPNAGKSTLLNRLLGRKIAIVTPKPQTTRRRLLGICTRPAAQVLLVDTPGIHAARGVMNERMVAHARQALAGADVVLWLVDAERGLGRDDRHVAELLRAAPRRVVLAINKIDAVPKPALLPLMAELGTLAPGSDIIPISALQGEHVDTLLARLVALLPEGPPYYDADAVTDETVRSIAAEIVREKVMIATRDEVPYAVATTVEAFEEKPERSLVVVKVAIHVDRESQKAIVIGRGGGRIKEIGQLARPEIEELLERRVFLELFVRVQPGWTKQAARLKEFGL